MVKKKFIGLTIEEAQKLHKNTRVVKHDGVYLNIAKNMDPTRINVFVVDNIITEVDYNG
jgi:hypothetical protein